MTIAKDSTARRAVGLPLTERVLIEGLPFSVIASFAGTAANNTGIGSLLLQGITKAFWAETAILSSDKNIILQLAFSGTAMGSGYSDFLEVLVGPGAPVVVPIRQLFRPSQYTLSTGSFGTVTIKILLDADGTNAHIRASVIGHSITDDMSFAADKVILHLGDSITAGGTGITAKYNQYDWRILAYHRDAGKSVRMVNLAMSGTTSGNYETRRLMGDLHMAQVDHINYSLGANDAAQAVSTSTFQTNVANMIAWKQSRYPAATMHVFGITPMENNTSETAAVAMRTAAQAAVTAAADSKVKYLNLGGAFDRTQGTSVYATTDAAGSRIHPNDAGHLAIWNVIKPFLDANPVLA